MPLTETLGEALAQPLGETVCRAEMDAEGQPECDGDGDAERVAFTESVASEDADVNTDSVGLTLGEEDADAEACAVREPLGESLTDAQAEPRMEEDAHCVPVAVTPMLRDKRGLNEGVGHPVALADTPTVAVTDTEPRGEALTDEEPVGEGEPRAEPVGGTTVTDGQRVAEEQGEVEGDGRTDVDAEGETDARWLPLAQALAVGVSPSRVEGEGLELAAAVALAGPREADTEGLLLTERLPPPLR